MVLLVEVILIGFLNYYLSYAIIIVYKVGFVNVKSYATPTVRFEHPILMGMLITNNYVPMARHMNHIGKCLFEIKQLIDYVFHGVPLLFLLLAQI